MPEQESLVQSDRTFGPDELALICSTVDLLPGLARKELALTLCEHLDWVTATGRPKVSACLKLLDKLEALGRVRLPAKRPFRRLAAPHGTFDGGQYRGIVRRVGSTRHSARSPTLSPYGRRPWRIANGSSGGSQAW